jgi:MFS family permease
MLLGLPFFIGFLHAASWSHALMLLVFPSLLNMCYLAPALAVVQNTVRPDRRAVAGALLLFVLNLIGLGGGPLFVGMMSDMYQKAGRSHPLTHALEALIPFFILAILCQLLAAWRLHKDRRVGL